MFQLIFSLPSYCPCLAILALLWLTFLFGFIGARATFHPVSLMTTRRASLAQAITGILSILAWGYVGFSVGMNACMLSVPAAWLACCAGTHRGIGHKARRAVWDGSERVTQPGDGLLEAGR